MEALEQKITVELTEEQYVHIQQILKQDKPSKTRLTRNEKDMIVHMCNKWHNVFDEDDETIKLLETIKHKLQ